MFWEGQKGPLRQPDPPGLLPVQQDLSHYDLQKPQWAKSLINDYISYCKKFTFNDTISRVLKIKKMYQDLLHILYLKTF